MIAARAKPNEYTNNTVNMGLRRSVVKAGCKRCGLVILMVSVSLLPQENTAGHEKLHASTCEELTQVSECLELESVTGRVQEEHRGLLTRLTLEAGVRFDDEPHARIAKTRGQRLPLILSQYHAKMRNGHIMAIDRIVRAFLAMNRRFQMRDDLMTE